MSLINKNSLALTVDNINERLLAGYKFSASEKKDILNFIVSRHAVPGSYRNMFAPFEKEMKNNVKLFTGEVLTTGASKSHILSEECCRILKQLNGSSKKASEAYRNSIESLKEGVEQSKSSPHYVYGAYCCAKCTAAYWRNISSDIKKYKRELKAGLKYLSSMRDGKGRWKKFPYYYTIYSLMSIDLPEARKELIYTSHLLEKAVKLNGRRDKYSQRRQQVVKKALEIINIQ